MEILNESALRKAIWAEVILLLITCMMGAVGAWNIFAWMALVTVLVPLYAIVLLLCLIFELMFDKQENEDGSCGFVQG